MPYSKNPDKYPLEIQQLPALLRNATQGEYNISARDGAEARGRKTQIQSYFAAVEARAKEMRAVAARTPATQADALSDAKAIAELWEDRARTVAGWMVRVLELGGQAYVQLARRTTGAFGDALTAAFEGVVANDAPAPPPADSLEAQLELLRLASAQLQAGGTKTD